MPCVANRPYGSARLVGNRGVGMYTSFTAFVRTNTDYCDYGAVLTSSGNETGFPRCRVTNIKSGLGLVGICRCRITIHGNANGG